MANFEQSKGEDGSNYLFKIWLLRFLLREWSNYWPTRKYYSAFVLTRIWDISIKLRFDFGTKNLEFASASNFEARPRFAEI